MFNPNVTYRMYLVEEGDDDREAVLEATIKGLTINSKPVYEEVYSDYSTLTHSRFMVSDGITMEDIIRQYVIRNSKKEYEDGSG